MLASGIRRVDGVPASPNRNCSQGLNAVSRRASLPSILSIREPAPEPRGCLHGTAHATAIPATYIAEEYSCQWWKRHEAGKIHEPLAVGSICRVQRGSAGWKAANPQVA
jgi:hypothetical protein